jgi:hypothetical protein
MNPRVGPVQLASRGGLGHNFPAGSLLASLLLPGFFRMRPHASRFLLLTVVWLMVVAWGTAWLAAQPALKRRAATGTLSPPKFDEKSRQFFFKDAREQLVGERGVAPAAGSTPANTPATAASDAGENSGSGDFAWSALVSASTLEDEIKAQVSDVTTATKSPSEFKGGGYEVTRVSYTYLATLFNVISQYDSDVRFKKDAVGLAAMFSRAGFNSKVGTDNSFKEAKLRGENLKEIIGGGSAELPKAEAGAPWADVVNRSPLMKRMDTSSLQRLKPWTADKASFIKNKDAIIREAEVLAMLAHVIQDPSFEYADDETYLEQAINVQKQAQAVIEAAKSDNVDQAQSAVSQINKSCTNCHESFRGGG